MRIVFLLLLPAFGAGCAASGWQAPALWGQKSEPQSVGQMLGASSDEKTNVTQYNKETGAAKSAQATAKPESNKKLSKKEVAAQQASAMEYIEQLAAAKALEEKHKLDDARKIYQQLIVKHPERPEPYHRLGVVADKQKRHREAQSLYTQALQRKPLDPEALNNLGYCFYLQGKLDKAESAITKAVSLAPAEPRYRNNLGLVLGHLGREEASLDQFRHAGSEADAQYNLAFIQMTRGDDDGAKQRLRLALLSDPSHKQSQLALQEYESPSRLSEGKMLAQSHGRFVPYLEETDGAPHGQLTSGESADSGPLEVVEGGPAPAYSAAPRMLNNAAARSLQTARFGQPALTNAERDRLAAGGDAVPTAGYQPAQNATQRAGYAGPSSVYADMDPATAAETQALQAQVQAMLQSRMANGQ